MPKLLDSESGKTAATQAVGDVAGAVADPKAGSARIRPPPTTRSSPATRAPSPPGRAALEAATMATIARDKISKLWS